MTTYSIENVDRLRKAVSGSTPPTKKAELSQYFTPAPIAKYMASLFSPELAGEISLLDAGAGNGMLTAAFLDLWLEQCRPKDTILASAYELDASLKDVLAQVLERYSTRANASDANLIASIHNEDFIEAAHRFLLDDRFKGFTHAILNPPYKKISRESKHRKLLREIGIETVNLYSAFVGLAVLLLKPQGELVAIIPRSFCNGPYYRPFRKQLTSKTAIRHIHLFGARDKAFSGDGVLQENIIIHLVKGGAYQKVRISSSTDATFSDYRTREVALTDVIKLNDPDAVIHIPAEQANVRQQVLVGATHTLAELGVQVSTGPVVDFRLREELRDSLIECTVPLLYPAHFASFRLRYPLMNGNKPNAIARNCNTEKWLFPNGCYTVVRRFTSKEERKRVVASVLLSTDLPSKMIGFENHLNVFHKNRNGLPIELAYGIAGYLNSSFVDEHFREFSGHTQVNASDLRFLPYPSLETLLQLGQEFLSSSISDQDSLDSIVAAYL